MRNLEDDHDANEDNGFCESLADATEKVKHLNLSKEAVSTYLASTLLLQVHAVLDDNRATGIGCSCGITKKQLLKKSPCLSGLSMTGAGSSTLETS